MEHIPFVLLLSLWLVLLSHESGKASSALCGMKTWLQFNLEKTLSQTSLVNVESLNRWCAVIKFLYQIKLTKVVVGLLPELQPISCPNLVLQQQPREVLSFGWRQVFHIRLTALDSVLPLNWAKYADFAKPLFVHLQRVVSSVSSVKIVSLS